VYAHSIYPHTKFPDKKVTKIKKWDTKAVESLFYPIVSKDELIPNLRCIKVESDWIVGTDKHILCKAKNQTYIKHDTYRLNKIVKLATTENLIGNLHTVWPEDLRFPNYEQVTPDTKNAMEVKEVKVPELYNFLFYYLKYKVYQYADNGWCKAGFYGKIDIHFDAKKMLGVLEFIQKIGDVSAKIYLHDHNRAIRIISKNSDNILMPLLYQTEDHALDCTKFLI
jgi:hypothetical protein